MERHTVTKESKSEKKLVLHSLADMQHVLRRERNRADRNEHEFSMLLFTLRASSHDTPLQTRFLHFLGKRLRSIDEVGWFETDQIGVILPYTSAENALIVAEGIRREFKDNINLRFEKVLAYPSIWPFKKEFEVTDEPRLSQSAL